MNTVSLYNAGIQGLSGSKTCQYNAEEMQACRPYRGWGRQMQEPCDAGGKVTEMLEAALYGQECDKNVSQGYAQITEKD